MRTGSLHSVVLHQVGKDAGGYPVSFDVARVAVDEYDRRTVSLIYIANPNAVRVEKVIWRAKGSWIGGCVTPQITVMLLSRTGMGAVPISTTAAAVAS